jgi:transcriptional regulator with XRE-family HTH domain
MTAGARVGRPDATMGARRVPGYLEITRGDVAEARKDIGRRLAEWRGAVELTQVELAGRISYSRSTLASVETGRHCAPRKFWQRVDREVGAAGGLVAAFDQVDALVRALQAQTVQARERQRAAKYAPPAAPVAADGCGCGVAVGLWTGRESRALRVALRMSMRVFGEHLGVQTSTVSGWESNDTAPLRLASQAVLDQALKLADADAKTRFGLILDSDADGACGAGTGGAGSVAGGSVVTPLHGRERTRTAS